MKTLATPERAKELSRDRLREPRRVGVISLGCAKNLVDSEVLLGELAQHGHEITDDLERAEVVIVNTCGFIDEAREESVDTILEVAERKGHGVDKLLVAGCMVNRYGAELQCEIPEIDGFIGLDDLRRVEPLVRLGSNQAPPQSRSHVVFDHRAPRLLTTTGHAFLKVAEGCDNPCTFCAIPLWRGRFRSRPIEDLVLEAQRLEGQGIGELCLIAQDTTRYGSDLGLGRSGLERLLEALLRETNIHWIRFLYAYPTTLDEGILRVMAAEERLVPYLDIPLQHSHAEILKAMRRGGSSARYLRLLERARELVPEITLRSTFIVGFPGENESHFEDLLEFVRAARFDHLGVFTYSPEEDTPSATLPGAVPRNVAVERRERLLAEQAPIALASRRRFVGRTVEALCEGVCEETDHLLQARHRGMAPGVDGRLLINDGTAPAGRFVQVAVTDAFPEDLVGHIVGPADREIVPARGIPGSESC